MIDTEFENASPPRGETDVSTEFQAPLEPVSALSASLTEVESLPSMPRVDGVPAGRDPESGRFLRGNRCGHGSPLAGKAAKLRAALFRAVGTTDISEIIAALIDKARHGDTVAARIILAYTLGDPVSLDVVEKIEKLEAVCIKMKGYRRACRSGRGRARGAKPSDKSKSGWHNRSSIPSFSRPAAASHLVYSAAESKRQWRPPWRRRATASLIRFSRVNHFKEDFMSTITEETAAEAAPKAKPSKAAIAAYRESVFSGQCDAQILFDARRIEAEWRSDRQTYLAREAAVASLRDELPRLQQKAAELAKQVGAAESFASSPIPDTVTVGELRDRLQGFKPPLKTGTPAELANALLRYVDAMPGGFVGAAKSAVVKAKGAVDSCRQRAEFTLRQTSVDGGQDATVARITAKAADIRKRIAGRRETLDAEALVMRQQAHCEAIARGDIEPRQRPMEPVTLTSRMDGIKAFYHAARARLDRLYELLAGKPAAIAANERDQTELAKLQVKANEAREAALQRLADPKAMKWCD